MKFEYVLNILEDDLKNKNKVKEGLAYSLDWLNELIFELKQAIKILKEREDK